MDRAAGAPVIRSRRHTTPLIEPIVDYEALHAAGELYDAEEVRRVTGWSETTMRRRIHARVITPLPRPTTLKQAKRYYRREDILRLRDGAGKP